MATETAITSTGTSVTIAGKQFLALREPADYWKWIAEGRYDHEWKVYNGYLTTQHTFLDLGAWVGAHSMYASSMAKRIIPVEPDPLAFGILEHNISLLSPNTFTRPLRCAVGKDGVVTLGSAVLGASTTRENLAAGGGIGEATETFSIPSISLRKFCAGLPEEPLFIKIDIEGSEEEIFKDSAFFAERKPTMLVELHPFWWREPEQAWENFRAVKALYKTAYEVPHPNSLTWVLA